MILEILVLILVVMLAYTWCGYPLLLVLASRRLSAGNAGSEGDRTESGRPLSVTVLLAAHNEESVIRDRLENLIEARSHVSGKRKEVRDIRVFVGLDACSDKTAAIAKELTGSHEYITVCEFDKRRGKVSVLKDLVAASAVNDGETEDILVMTDANTMFKPDAMDELLKHFSDPGVGGVCGRLEFREPDVSEDANKRAKSPEGVYWKMERQLKEMESIVDSCLGANGAIYAIRRGLFWSDIPNNTIVDDFVLGMKVREQSLRMVYEPAAVAEERIPEMEDEWSRRVRIGAGDYQAIQLCGRCLSRKYGKFAWSFWSHKVLRWFTPHALVILSIASVWLLFLKIREPLTVELSTFVVSYVSVPVLLFLFSSCAVFGSLLRDINERWAVPFRACDHFVTMQLALLAGFLRFCVGGLEGHWDRTPRGRHG